MSTEYRFFCPEQQREVSTAECYDRGDTGRACYGECCSHVEQAVLMIVQERLQAQCGERIITEYRAADSMLVIRFHAHLTPEAYYDSLFRTIDFDAYMGVDHGHGFPAEDAEGLVRLAEQLLRGEAAFVVQPIGLLPGSLRLVSREELAATTGADTPGAAVRKSSMGAACLTRIHPAIVRHKKKEETQAAQCLKTCQAAQSML